MTNKAYAGLEANETFQAYQRYQVTMAFQFGADKDQAEIEMMDALEFERTLSNVNLLILIEIILIKLF